VLTLVAEKQHIDADNLHRHLQCVTQRATNDRLQVYRQNIEVCANGEELIEDLYTRPFEKSPVMTLYLSHKRHCNSKELGKRT
jgi:hypothetical protein